MAQDNIKNLYEALKDDYDLGTEQDFRKSLGNKDARHALYDTIKDDYELGSEDDFNNSLGIQTATTVQPTANPAPSAATQQGKTQAGAAARQVVDEYNKSVKQAEAPVDHYKQSVERTSYVIDPKYKNVVMAAPTEEQLKKYPSLRKDEAIMWNTDTGEPLMTYTDENGKAISVNDAYVRNAKAMMTGDDSQKAHAEPASLELPEDVVATAPRTVPGGLDQMTDNYLTSQYGEKWRYKQYTDADGNQISAEDLANQYKQAFYDNLNDSMRKARIALASGSVDPDKLMKQMNDQWGNVIHPQDMERYLTDKEATQQDLHNYAVEQLERAYAERNLIREQMDKKGKEIDASTSPFVDQWNADGRKFDGEYTQLKTHLQSVENQIKSWEAVRDAKDIGILRGLQNTLFDPQSWDFGQSAFERGLSILTETGEDRFRLAERIGEEQNAAIFEDFNTPNFYRWAKIAGQSAPFMADFMAGSGIVDAVGKGVGKLTAKGIERAALKGLTKTIVKNMGVGAGDIAGSYALATTVQGLKTAGDIMERKAGREKSGMVVTNDRLGRTYFAGDLNPVSWGKAIYQGTTSAAVENYTEMISKHLHIGKAIIDFMPKIGLGRVSNAITKMTRSEWSKGIDKYMQKAGIGELPDEIMEEEIGIPLNAALVGDQEFSDLLDPKQQMDIIGGITLSVGAMRAGSLLAGGIDNAAVQAMYLADERKLDKAESGIVEVLGSDKWAKIKPTLDDTTNENLAESLMNIANDETLNNEQKQAIGNYTTHLLLMRGHNLGANASVMAKEQQKAEFAQIKPVDTSAEFGYVYDQFKGEANDAAEFLVSRKGGLATGAFHREELGDINMAYGDENRGLYHMIIRHIVEQDDFNSIAELTKSIDDVISNGEMNNYGDSIVFNKDGYGAAVVEDEFGNYVLTAYGTSRKKAERKRSEADASRLYQSIFENEDGNLVPQNSTSNDKGTDFSANRQKIGCTTGRGVDGKARYLTLNLSKVPFCDSKFL